MWHLYLDESGDLGFDFANKKPSKYFTISILLVKETKLNRRLINGVKKTLRRKLNRKRKAKSAMKELKGRQTSFEIKRYFYRQLSEIPFELYCITLDKRKAFSLMKEKEQRVYNYVARLALDQIPFEAISGRIELIVDKSQGMTGIRAFNSYIINHLQGRLNPLVPLTIYHRSSETDYALQAVDMFSWGIFQKYERRNMEWFEKFSGKISSDRIYP